MLPLDRWILDRKDAERLFWITDGRIRIKDVKLARKVIASHLCACGYEHGGYAVYVRHHRGVGYAPGARERCILRGDRIHRATRNDAMTGWRLLRPLDLLRAAQRVMRAAHRRLCKPPPRQANKPGGWQLCGTMQNGSAHYFKRGEPSPVCGGGSMLPATLRVRREAKRRDVRCLRCLGALGRRA